MSECFPILRPYEVVGCLADLGIGVTDQDLLKPTPMMMKSIYMQLLERLACITKEEIEQPVFGAMHVLEFPELHEDSIPELAFGSALKDLMNACQLLSFSLKDVYKPTPERIMICLSAVINFAKFREERLSHYQQMAEESNQYRAQLQAAEEEQQHLLDILQRTQEQLASEEPQIRQLSHETQQLELEVFSLQKEQQKLAQETQNYKQQSKQLEEQISNSQFMVMNARQEGQRLRAQIIPSPEKFKRTIVEMEEAIETEKRNMHIADVRARELLARTDCLVKIEKDVQQCCSVMEDAHEQQVAIKDNNHTIKEWMQQAEATRASHRELETKLAHLKRKIQNTEDKRVRLQQQRVEKEKAAQENLGEVQEQQENTLKLLKHGQATVAQNDQQIRKTVKKMSEVKAHYNQEVEELHLMYEDLEALVHQFHHTLYCAMRRA